MTLIKGPWYITRTAIEDYRWLAQREGYYVSETEALRRLVDLCCETVSSGREGHRKTSLTPDRDVVHYRGSQPLRLSLYVSMTVRAEGDRPQLVRVTRGRLARPREHEHSFV